MALSEVFPLNSPREAGNRRERKREGREGSGRGYREKKEDDDQEEEKSLYLQYSSVWET